MADGKKLEPFTSFSNVLDARVLRALASQGFSTPTLIQSRILKSALTSSKDVLARSRTGSGKTLAYGICLVQRILTVKARYAKTDVDREATRAIILVPTKELAEQVTTHLRALCDALGDDALRVLNIASASTKVAKAASGERIQRLQLGDKPDIVVATPSRCLAHLRKQAFTLRNIEGLVIDEADLILSYGQSADDIASILQGPWDLPANYQRFLMSATLTGEVEELQGIVLKDPEIILIKDEEEPNSNLSQFAIRCTEVDKFLLIYVLLKLKLIRGKMLIFVNDIDRGYRLKLFLERFGLRSGVLNSELPFNSRFHAVQEFNRGVFDYLIATDDAGIDATEDEDKGEGTSNLLSTQVGTENNENEERPRKRKRKHSKHGSRAEEYGVSRGIDFIDVACVLNFDLPASARAYTHRVGRTARAGKQGMSLSFVVPLSSIEDAAAKKWKDVGLPTARRDEVVWRKIEKDQKKKGSTLKEYKIDLKLVEGFRYRMEDGLKAVTRATVREARIKELKAEILNSERLKAHWEDNPKDLEYLKHDKALVKSSRLQPHLKHVPSYLIPKIAPVGALQQPAQPSGESESITEAKQQQPQESRVSFHKNKRGDHARKGKKNFGAKRSKMDPLKKFSAKKR